MSVVLLLKVVDHDVVFEVPVLGKTTIGRSSSSDFKLNDKKVSARHCSFEIDVHGHVIFTDLGSSNGSYLNNSLITKTMVKINDIIKIGNTFIKIDPSRLNSKERLRIGHSTHAGESDFSLPAFTPDTRTNEKMSVQKKITIVFDRSTQNKKLKKISKLGHKEQVYDQASEDLKEIIKDEKIKPKK